jgi:PilZ domain
MTLSSMVVSRDWQEVSVLECILGGLHIGVDVVDDADRARTKLAKSKIDALIIDCDLTGTSGFLRTLHDKQQNSVPLVIVSGSSGRDHLEATGASFVFEKPISVEQAVHTLSAARNMIMDGRLHYHRQALQIPVSLSCGSKTRLDAQLTNISQGGVALRADSPVPVTGPVRLSFALPGTGTPLRLLGKVAWMDKQGNAGIRFVQISGRAKRDLQLWLERQYFVRR